MVDKNINVGPLQTLLAELALPFSMQSLNRDIFIHVITNNVNKPVKPQNFLLMLVAILQKVLKPQFLSFAADCAELYGSKHHFVEKSDEA